MKQAWEWGILKRKADQTRSLKEGSVRMKELEVDAALDQLSNVLAFIDEALEEAGCGMKAQMQLDVAAEEIFVNIAHYAYTPETGKALIRIAFEDDGKTVCISFVDSGRPFDPLAKEDPDVTLSAEERKIGGLGIYMVKKSMDDVSYEYRDGQNMLTIKKQI